MYYKVEFDADEFSWWSGAKDTVESIREAGKMEEFQEHIEEIFDDTPTDVAINDYVWHESEHVFEALGLDEDGNLSDDEYEGDDDEDE